MGRWLLLGCLFGLWLSRAEAQFLLPATPRALALGESFVALADDAQTIVWNPAGVSRVRRYTAEAAYAQLFQWLRLNRLGGILPATPQLALGFDWHREGFADSEIHFTRDLFRLAYSFAPFEALSLGVNLKYVSLGLSADGLEVGNATGWGTDWGLWWQPGQRWTVGAVAYDALGVHQGRLRQGTFIRFETTGTRERLFAPRYAVGVAFRPTRRWKLLGEFSGGWHVGVEYQPIDNLQFQVGLHRGTGSMRPTFSLGAALAVRWLSLSYAYVDAPRLEKTSLVGASMRFDFQPPSVEIEQVRFRPIYPVLMYAYAQVNHAAPEQVLDSYVPVVYSEKQLDEAYPLHPLDRVGRIWLRNLTSRTVSFKVVVSLESYIRRQGTEAIALAQLAPHQRASFPLRRLVLTPKVLQVTSPQTVEATVEVRDLSDETRRRTRRSTVIQLYGRNQIQLEDIAQLAAFISPTNARVRGFVRQVLKANAPQIERSSLRRNYLVARLLFDALRGIAYASDPNIPRERGFMDEVRFPQELLGALADAANRGRPLGDCDDSTVLVSAVFEAAGIPTALIQLPGHVLLAFDPGRIPLEKAEEEGFSKLCAPINGYAWIPLETTQIRQGFDAAWREGLRQLEKGIYDSITLREAWERYPPVDLPSEERTFPLRIPAREPNAWDRYFIAPE